MMPQPVPTWYYDPRTKRYHDDVTHRFLAFATVEGLMEKSLDAFHKEADTLSALIADKAMPVGEWEAGMQAVVRRAYEANCILARGGLAQVTDEDREKIHELLEFQFERLDRFAGQIVDEHWTAKGGAIRRRADMYVNSARQIFWYIETQNQKEIGGKWERWVLIGGVGDENTCADCIALSAKGWVELGTLPQPTDGSTQCFFNHRQVTVLTQERGIVRLKDVKAGEQVLTHKGRFKRVLGLAALAVADMSAVKLRTKFGKTKVNMMVTPDHLFMGADGAWTRADTLRPGDRLVRVGKRCEREGCENVVTTARNNKLRYCSNSCATIAGKKYSKAHEAGARLTAAGQNALAKWRRSVGKEVVWKERSKAYVAVGDAVVTSVMRQQVKKGNVHCLVVEDDNSFVATHGLVSHNCLSSCRCSKRYSKAKKRPRMRGALRAFLKIAVGLKVAERLGFSPKPQERGSEKSGYHAPHKGRPGQVGGSSPRDGISESKLPFDELDSTAEALRKAKELYGLDVADFGYMFDLDGLREEVEITYREDNNSIRLFVTWYDGDMLQGETTRIFQIHETGEVFCENRSLVFKAVARQQGFGSELYARQIRRLRERGFKHIVLMADRIGTYAWAKNGFDYNYPGRLHEVNQKFRTWAELHDVPMPSDGWPHFTSAHDVAIYEHPSGYRMTGGQINNGDVSDLAKLKLGKAFMLDKASGGHGGWEAVLQLQRERK